MTPFLIAAWCLCGIFEIERHNKWWQSKFPTLRWEYSFIPWYRDNWTAYLCGPVALIVGEYQRRHMGR